MKTNVETNKKNVDAGALIKKLLPFIGVIVVAVFFQIMTGGRLLTLGNSKTLLNEIFSIGLATAGIIFVMAQGELDFALGSMIALAGGLGALAARINPYLLIPVSLLAGIAMGVINGFVVARLNAPSFVATLAMSFAYKGLVIFALDGSIGIPYELGAFDNNALKLVVFVVVMVIGYIVFEHTKFGKHCRAIGTLPEAARQAGVNLDKTRWIAFIISGFMCGVIAFFSVVRTCTAGTTNGGGMELNALIALMVGGMSITGGWSSRFRTAIIGCLMMGIISNGMTIWGIDGVAQEFVRGVIFIIAVTLSFDRKEVTVIK